MNDRQALVFEIYRYAVCFVMLLIFLFMALAGLSALITDPNNIFGAASAGVGVLLSAAIFGLHWRMKNPAFKA